ncbi:phosphatidylinositol glycan anchor biosynthesis class L [Brevipalpus obovatus]|uniref:phosphatidylinositol glycan anchor biosynthesis class L n=1 Tax=Brevipalpus obovatus TaxID=246614 RepID=UPI003D9F3EA0
MKFWLILVSHLMVCYFVLIISSCNYSENFRDIFHNRSTLLLIAHPDDESMFFGPLLIQLIAKSPETVYLMCLSSGNNYGQGEIRKKELVDAMKLLTLPPENVFLLDDKEIKDGFHEVWDHQHVSDLVSKRIDSLNITNVISFDEHGVSGHPNHIDVFKSIEELARRRSDLSFFSLFTVNKLRKYSIFMDIPFSALENMIYNHLLVSISFYDYLRLLRVLIQHRSQMLWFRWLYAFFSRYMFINTLIPWTTSLPG